MRGLRHCTAVLVWTAGQALGAEAIGILGVAPPPGPGPDLVEVTVQLGRLVAARRGGVLDPRELRERMTGPPTGATLQELERALEGARAAYLGGDYEGSVLTLRTIVEQAERLPEGRETFALWTRAMLRLARTELHLGRGADANATIERLVRAAPDVEVDPALHPPRFVQRIEAARSARRAAATRTLTVTAPGEGVRVFVDRREVGMAPVQLALPPGRYAVAAVRGALRVLDPDVDLEGGDRRVALDLDVAESLRPELGPGLVAAADERARRVVAAGGRLGLDAVVAVSLADEAGAPYVVGSLYDVRAGMLRREARVRLSGGIVPVGGLGALAEFLVTGQLTSTLVEVPGETRRAPPASAAIGPPVARQDPGALAAAPDPGRRSRVPGWVALGASVAAVGLAVGAGVETQQAGSRYDQARDLRAQGNLSTADVLRYNGWVTQGDAAARRAALLWAGAGACAATAAVLGWIQYRRTGEIGPLRF